MNEKVESLNDQRIKKEDGDKKIALSEIASFLRRTSSKFFFERETEEREEVTVGTTKLVLRNFFFLQCTLETGSISRLRFNHQQIFNS